MNNNELTIINENTIKDKIYIVRGIPVMLDRDLALIYGYSVKRLNEQVQRNIEKFPSDMMFQLSRNEMYFVKSQIATSREVAYFTGQNGGVRKLPYVFTEQGIYMLMTVLKGDLATKQSIELVRRFKEMREHINNEHNLLLNHEQRINEIVFDINDIHNQIDNIHNKLLPSKNKAFMVSNDSRYELDIFFEDLFTKATKSIMIIDNYISTKTLYLLRHVDSKINIKIYTTNLSSKNSIKEFEYRDFMKDYNNLNINIYDSRDKIHDRFIILDYNTKRQRIFSIGSSIKDTGNKISTVIETKDLVLSDSFIKAINESIEYKWISV